MWVSVGYVEECIILEGFNDINSLVIDLGEEKKTNRNRIKLPFSHKKIKSTKIIVFSNVKSKKLGKDFESKRMISTASSKQGE